MFFLVIFLAAFSIIRNGERTIDFDSINYLDSKFKFISVESVDKLLKQSDSISLKLMKRNLNLGSLERIINKNAFIYSAEVSLSLDSEIGIKIIEKEPVFRVLKDKYYIDSSGDKMPLSKNYSERIPLILKDIDSTKLISLGMLGDYFKNDNFLNGHIIGLEIINNEFIFHVNNFSYLVKMKDLNQYKNRFKNYKAFYKSALNDSILDKASSINLNFRNQVIVQKK
jgi:cell division protein FtsQ